MSISVNIFSLKVFWFLCFNLQYIVLFLLLYIKLLTLIFSYFVSQSLIKQVMEEKHKMIRLFFRKSGIDSNTQTYQQIENDIVLGYFYNFSSQLDPFHSFYVSSGQLNLFKPFLEKNLRTYHWFTKPPKNSSHIC